MSIGAADFRAQEDRRNQYLSDLSKTARDFPEFKLDEIEEFKEHFIELDADHSGDLDIFEIQRMFESVGQTKTNAELRVIMTEADTDGSGTIDFKEFLTMMVQNRRFGKPCPIVLTGRIAKSGLASRAMFYESLAKPDSAKYAEDQRLLKRQREHEEHQKAIKDEADRVDRERRRKEFLAKANSNFGGGGGGK